MITEHDEKIVEAIKKYIDQQAMVSETKVDWEKIHWIETLDRLVNNLRIAPVSFRFCSPEDVEERYYTAVVNFLMEVVLLLTQETTLIALAPCVGMLI
jgi:hypothetical protein